MQIKHNIITSDASCLLALFLTFFPYSILSIKTMAVEQILAHVATLASYARYSDNC